MQVAGPSKYYKGLGTSTSKEGKDYFKNLHKHKKDFLWMDELGRGCDRACVYLVLTLITIRRFINDFINKELILFSMADLQRSITSMFSGYVSEHSAYHHGEQSLAGTIIGMAQDFVGSNNINLLQPNGQFGTRSVGGKDHASARYIYTQLSPITRYIPIIPTVLVNGCEGIGTGWSPFIPNYNPRDVVANIRRLLNGEMMEPMNPWYRGFKGTIEKGASKEGGCSSYTVNGVINEVNETTLRITELPVRRWTDDYKAFLNSVTEGTRDENGNLPKDPFVKDFRKYGDDAAVDFEVQLSEENMLVAKQEGLLKKFKLTTTISTSNMHLFDSAGFLKIFSTYGLNTTRQGRSGFILGVVRGEIIVNNRKRADLLLELHQKGFNPIPKKSKAVVAGATDDTEEAEDSPDVSGVRASDYDYLLSMGNWNLDT
ncbi:LOW QUALITY PROTEIN: DNA topoisomerase 2 [Populus alba x Populus x berolinensis]|nr:LOW QUALITY PROTEIN: DNA topoisomerase 2 [Populus alba x Populus x berolinensis]